MLVILQNLNLFHLQIVIANRQFEFYFHQNVQQSLREQK